jgi:hypothetical protein
VLFGLPNNLSLAHVRNIYAMMIKIAALLLLSTLSTGEINAQTSPKHRTAPAAGFLKTSFDTSSDRLSPGFKGHDFDAVWLALRSRAETFEKSAYETQEAYEERLSLTMAAELSPSLPISIKEGVWAFVTGPSEVAELASDYDAETQQQSIYLPYTPGDENSKNGGPNVWKLSTSFQSRGSYVGTNAFGASARVSRTHYIERNLAANMPLWLFHKSSSPWDTDFSDPTEEQIKGSRKVAFSMSPAFAETHSKQIRCIIIGTLKLPLTDEEKDLTEATISEPAEVTTLRENIFMDIKEVWFFDQSTGEILLKLKH